MFSSHKIPSFDAHWNALSQESLISFIYWTPLDISTNIFGPDVSGPKHQIFYVSYFSHPNFSDKILALSFGSSFGPKSPFSMTSGKPSYKG